MTTAAKGQGLNEALTNALNKRKAQGTIRNLSIQPPGSVDFSSNDFLSLATSHGLRKLYLEELRTGPCTVNLGSGGSRLLDGNSTYAEQLEDDIANFHRAEKGLLCNSGFDANAGLFSCLPQPGDVIVYDEFIHASVHDGMRLSRAGQKLAFAHNSADALQATLQHLLQTDGEIKTGRHNVFVAVEAVYSMDGDVAPLKEIVRVMHKLLPLGNGYLIVDEAHSNGVLGPKGRGLVCQLGLEKEVSIRLHTFGKALACNGGMATRRSEGKQRC
jgi:8-amino-7-oxononanoate synthase